MSSIDREFVAARMETGRRVSAIADPFDSLPAVEELPRPIKLWCNFRLMEGLDYVDEILPIGSQGLLSVLTDCCASVRGIEVLLHQHPDWTDARPRDCSELQRALWRSALETREGYVLIVPPDVAVDGRPEAWPSRITVSQDDSMPSVFRIPEVAVGTYVLADCRKRIERAKLRVSFGPALRVLHRRRSKRQTIPRVKK